MQDPPAPDQQQPETRRHTISTPTAGCIYFLLTAAGVAGAILILDQSPLWLPDAPAVSLLTKVVLGAGVGIAVFVLDQLAERFLPLFNRMGEALRNLLGELSMTQVLMLAAFSAVGEEVFFRGFLLPWVGLIASSILFGALHIAPDRRLWPWPILATAMGFAFGWLFEYTGDVLAPILAHFTINYFGVMVLARRGRPDTEPV